MEKEHYKINCSLCDKEYLIEMTNEQKHRLDKYKSGEGLLQNMLADFSDEIREMFLTGICPVCWTKEFGEEPVY